MAYVAFCGATEGDCRTLDWPTGERSTAQTETLAFASNTSSLQQDLHSEDTSDRSGEWHGDALSRLVFYSEPFWHYAGGATLWRGLTPMLAAPDREEVRLAYAVPYSNRAILKLLAFLFGGTIKETHSITLPEPCFGGECSTWASVESVDIGRCSLHLPYGDSSSPSTLLKDLVSQDNDGANVDDLYIATSLAQGILHKLPTEAERYCNPDGWRRLCADVKFRRHPEYSTWYVSNNGHDLCIQAYADLWHTRFHFRVNHGTNQVRCNWNPITLTVCGHIRMDSEQHLQWKTTSTDVDFVGSKNGCKSKVLSGVQSELDDAVYADDDGTNEVSEQLRQQIGRRFSFTKDDVGSFLPKIIKPVYDALFQPCSNPGLGWGNPVTNPEECQIRKAGSVEIINNARSLLGELPWRCVYSTPGAPQSAPECRIESIV